MKLRMVGAVLIGFRVDRSNTYFAGQIVHNITNFSVGSVKFDTILNNLFSDGLSSHGKNYLGTALAYKDASDLVAEIVYEYVRLSQYPNRPSRYTSVFAFENAEDKDKHPTFSPYKNIFEVEAKEYFRADMMYIHSTVSTHSGVESTFSLPRLFYYANQYWSGAMSENPLPELLLVPPVKIIRQIEVNS